MSAWPRAKSEARSKFDRKRRSEPSSSFIIISLSFFNSLFNNSCCFCLCILICNFNSGLSVASLALLPPVADAN